MAKHSQHPPWSLVVLIAVIATCLAIPGGFAIALVLISVLLRL